jgi:hypothetical protein
VITAPRFHEEGFLTDEVHYGEYHAKKKEEKKKKNWLGF